MVNLESTIDRLDLCACFLRVHVITQSSNCRETSSRKTSLVEIGGVDHRHPEVFTGWKVETLRHHANHSDRHAVDVDRRIDDVRAPAHVCFPEAMVEDRHWRGAGRFIGWREV